MKEAITVYRLGHPSYIDRLDGEGAALRGGRWNLPGQRMVYTAQTSSLAILEVLAHIADFKDPLPYQLVEIQLSIHSLLHYTDLSAELPPAWSLHQAGDKITRSIGSEWIRKKNSAVLVVPSVHNPLESNYLLNPDHPELEAKITGKHWYLYDHRLIRK